MEDMTDIKEMVDDYMERNQESFDEFENPDDCYSEIVEQLDGLEVCSIPLLLGLILLFNRF